MIDPGVDKVFNFREISGRIATSGQPSAQQFEQIRDAGYEAIIDLAPVDLDRYSFPGEPEKVAELGMEYFHIPVDFKDPTDIDFFLFSEAMDETQAKKVWIHCAANYRVSVFYALWAEKNENWTISESDILIRSVWESDPTWQMNDVWRSFIQSIREEAPIESLL